MPKRIVIIGAHAAGVDAASAARRTDRNAEITLITKQRQAGYSPCESPLLSVDIYQALENLRALRKLH